MQPPKKPNAPTSVDRATRSTRGFMQTGGILSKHIRTASESRGFSETRLLTHWSEIAGPSIAGIARPVKIGYTRQGIGATLTLLTSGANAPMVQMQLPQIKDRVNATYGYAAISRIHITQTAPTGFAEPQTAFTTQMAAKRPIEDSDKQALAQSLSNVADDGLKAALAALGENILSKPKS
jgi:hypothetical protein